MKIVWSLFFVWGLILTGFFSGPSLVNAVATTNSDQNPSQVQLNSNGEVIYLSTSINDGVVHPTPQTNSSLLRDTTEIIPHLSTQIRQPIGFASDFGSYLSSILSLVMVISLLLVFLQFILAGFQWITSGGDKGKTEEARNKIINAFVGILIVSSSFAVAGFVAWILGFESINQALAGISRINPS